MIYTNSLHQPSQTSFHLTMIFPLPADQPADHHVSGQSCSCDCATQFVMLPDCSSLHQKSSLSTNLVKSEHTDTKFYIYFQCDSAFINLLKNHRKKDAHHNFRTCQFSFQNQSNPLIHFRGHIANYSFLFQHSFNDANLSNMLGSSCSPQHNSLNP